jgi:RDD family
MTAFGGALDDPTKIMGSRIGAYAIDLMIVGIVIVGALYVFELSNYRNYRLNDPAAAQQFCDQVNGDVAPGRVSEDFGGTRGSDRCKVVGNQALVSVNGTIGEARAKVWATGAAVSFLNLVLLTAATGASIGKMVFGLRVVTANGQRAGIGRNLIRWLLLAVDTAFCWLPGLLTSYNSKGHRRIGDMAAGTFVVHRSAMGRLLNIPGYQVVRTHDAFGGWGPAPAEPELGLGEGGGIDAPVFDPSRNTYVRYDQDSGVWFQWDDQDKAWIPAKA